MRAATTRSEDLRPAEGMLNGIIIGGAFYGLAFIVWILWRFA